MRISNNTRWYLFISSILAVFVTGVATQSSATISGEELTTFKHQGKVLDTAVSADGSLFFVLTDKKEVLVHSLNGKTETPLKVDGNYDLITASPRANFVFLTDSNAQITKLIEISIIQEFSYEGSPFKGPVDAPVTIAVFSDFQ